MLYLHMLKYMYTVKGILKNGSFYEVAVIIFSFSVFRTCFDVSNIIFNHYEHIVKIYQMVGTFNYYTINIYKFKYSLTVKLIVNEPAERRVARRQGIVTRPREECCMEKNSRSAAESISVRCKVNGVRM